MADPIYYTQIKQKIAQFERGKEQVQVHLALVERRIALLHQALSPSRADGFQLSLP